jgi:hypothetical protein
MEPRYLTKSRFKTGLECPVKLYYSKKEEYFDAKLEDDFLQSLAEGGFQVGELAKLYYPGGINIDELNYDDSVNRTNELLKEPEVIIYEAAFRHQHLFIRADIVVKKANAIQLIEVKAKSFDPQRHSFLNNGGFIIPSWAPYLYDAAFQKFVIKKAFPAFTVTAYLLLTDKSKIATVDGLNQKFLLYTKDGRKGVKVKGAVEANALGDKILTLQNIDALVERIYDGTAHNEQTGPDFAERVAFYAENYANDQKIDHPLGSHCKDCEFRLPVENPTSRLKSGFHECWRSKAHFNDDDFLKPSILDIWKFTKKDEFIQQGIFFQSQLDQSNIEPKKPGKRNGPGLSQWERQWLQVEKSIANDQGHYIDISALRDLQKSWTYPLHFIDFETTTVAIPFTKGRRPYEQTAFQFSHHIFKKDGQIAHKSQWISMEPGVFPNFNFVRALKAALSGDEGTIFRYATHENTVLKSIYTQLLSSEEEDKDVLCEWIRHISHSKDEWAGPRDMVDLKEVIQRFYYHPLTKGSISIKHVMPAILNSSDYLREKYSKPIYGNEIPSLNFSDWQWVQFRAGGGLIDPYEMLPPIFEGIDPGILESSFNDEGEGIMDGGAAMTAFAKMQFTEMTDEERRKVASALLRYCELDTFAMVLVWEGLANWVNR